MSVGAALIKGLNRVFPQQKHPFNLQNDGSKTYAQWQYEMGERTIAFYLERYTTQEMFQGKRVLDMGCGAGGKTLYYASLGVESIVGTDLVTSYQEEAEGLAKQLGYENVFTFVPGDATKLPFPDGSFDTIIMNDFMEHVQDPEAVLREGFRLLRSGGRIFTNFPPYYHPFGAHLSDAVNMPWVHVFFKESSLIEAYKDLIAHCPDAQARLSLRLSKDETGKEYFSYINKMTIRRFQGILRTLHLTPVFYREIPLRPFLKPLAHSPLKEYFVKMVVCVLEKP